MIIILHEIFVYLLIKDRYSHKMNFRIEVFQLSLQLPVFKYIDEHTLDNTLNTNQLFNVEC